MIRKSLFLSVLFTYFGAIPAYAASINFFELSLYVDGSVSAFSSPNSVTCQDCLVNLDSSGLGTVSFNSIGVGSHTIGMMIDYDIAYIPTMPSTYFNEYGEVLGVPASGLSWEIDEPGYLFGDIPYNFVLGFLDNFNNVSVSVADDVSMAMMWDFVVAPTEIAQVVFNVTLFDTGNFFNLIQKDLEVSDAVFMSSSLSISAVPEPSTYLLFAVGFALIGWLNRKHLCAQYRLSR